MLSSLCALSPKSDTGKCLWGGVFSELTTHLFSGNRALKRDPSLTAQLPPQVPTHRECLQCALPPPPLLPSPTRHRDSTSWAFSAQQPTGRCWVPPPAFPGARPAAPSQRNSSLGRTGQLLQEHSHHPQKCTGARDCVGWGEDSPKCLSETSREKSIL